MAHDHHHDHSHAGTYYMDQLCTIASCGALGGVAVMLYATNKLSLILADQFFVPVLTGGVALLALVIIRAVTLWREAGRAVAHSHDDHHHDHHHQHGHDPHSDHDHDDCCDHSHDHLHDHGHDHSWTPARYAVLMLPIALYFLNLPNASFSQETMQRMLTNPGLQSAKEVASKEGVVLGFKELANAAYSPNTRKEMTGKTGKIAGMYAPARGNAKAFTLFRLNMTCCQADTVPVEMFIICEENITRFEYGNWVEVEGQIQFQKVSGEKYLPVLYLKSADQVKPTNARSGFEI